jgi:hypothetical protein
VPRRRPRPPGQLDGGPLAANIASFRLHLAAEGKSARMESHSVNTPQARFTSETHLPAADSVGEVRRLSRTFDRAHIGRFSVWWEQPQQTVGAKGADWECCR